MPQPPAGQDYYLVVPLSDTTTGVMGSAQVFVATGSSEEAAIAKVHAMFKPPTNLPEGSPPPAPPPTLYLAQVAPTFPAPS